MLLVLDMDETLVRVCCDGVHRGRELKKVDFWVPIGVGKGPKRDVFDCGVSVRPGLDKFMEWILDRRRTGLIEGPWVFTTSTLEYTQAILSKLDPDGKVFGDRILAREACTPARLPGFFMKDLSRVPCEQGSSEGGAERGVLVDNNPVSFVLNPGPSVLVRDWVGDNHVDSELSRVQALLDDLAVDARMEATINAAAGGGVDYAAAVSRAVHGHDRFRSRLGGLADLLGEFPQGSTELLRNAMKAATADANDIKRELIGGL